MFEKMIALMMIVFGLFSSYPILAVNFLPPSVPDGEHFLPPSVPDGEQLTNSPSAQASLKNINRGIVFNSVDFSPDGKYLASGYWNGMVLVWEVATGKKVQQLEGHKDSVSSVAYSPDGKFLASGSHDNTVRVWEVDTGKALQRLEEHSSDVNSVAYSPDGKFLASGSSDKTVRVWEVDTRKASQRFEGHSSDVNSVAYSPDGKFLASGSDDNTVRVWEVDTRKASQRFEGHNGIVCSVAYSPDGKFLASGSFDNTVRVWEVATGKALQRLKEDNSIVWSVVYSPEGKFLASTSSENTVRVWEVATGKALQLLEGNKDIINSIAYSPDGKLLAFGSYEHVWVWEVATGKALQGNEGCNISGKCLWYANGNIIKQRDEIKERLAAISPPKEEGQLTLISQPQKLVVKDGESKLFTLTFKNHGQGRVYWVNVIHDIIRDKNNKSPLTFTRSETIVILEPNETREVKVRVSALEDYDHTPGEKRYPLNLRITHAHGELEAVKIDVDVHTPNLKLQKIFVEGEYFPFDTFKKMLEALKNGQFFKPTQLLLSVQNEGQQALTEAVFRASLGKITLDDIIRQRLKAGESFNLSYALPEGMTFNEEMDLNFMAKKVLHPIHEWSFENQALTIQPPPGYFYAVPAITVFILFVLLYYWRVFRHPLVLAVSQKGFMTLALEELASAQRWLQRAKRWEALLSREQIPISRWQTAVAFSQTTEDQKRCQYWVNQLNYDWQETVETSPFAPWLFILKLDRDFILKIEQCFLAFPPTTLDEDELHKILQNTANTSILIGILISADLEQYAKLIKLQQKLPQIQIIWTVPSRNDLTRFLLAAPTESRQTFAQLISAQAKITRISPYQTGFGLEKACLFFGRVQQLSDIIGQEPKNNLLVGARQIGKTSLLKELERRYQANRDIDCFYFSLSAADSLKGDLAKAFGLPETVPFSKLLDHLAHSPQGKRSVLLIDEVDDFIHQEKQNKYETLFRLRDLSAEGRCYFILAGFWDLYQAIYADYHSPLKNFAETMRLGGLEAEACHALALKPMQALNIEYADLSLIEHIIEQTGRRANLIASVCHQTLGLLGSRRLIEQQDIERALDSKEIHDLVLGDWDKTEDELQSCLLRIIVYSTVNQEGFTEDELWEQLDKVIDFPYPPQHIHDALSRLELAFILEREQDQYHYSVPLFYNLLRKKGLSELLRKELAYFHRKFGI